MSASIASHVIPSLRGAGWAPASLFVLHVVLTLVFNAYLRVPGLDIPMHFIGGIAMAYFIADFIGRSQSARTVGALTPAVYRVLVVTTTGCVAVLWEFAEWIADRALRTHTQMGLDDTLLDLALGMTGAALFALISGGSAARR